MRTKSVPTQKQPKMTKRQLIIAEQQSLREAQNNLAAQDEFRSNKPIFGPLVPRNEKQSEVLEDLRDAMIRMMFLVGPAGTGKTFVPTSFAAEELVNQKIDQIVITRPMVGCDEDMGFLPGTEQEKFEGWVGPFMEILQGKLGRAKLKTYMDNGAIVAKPLMMMRGSTFRRSVVILDEAQNSTTGQMKMFLTRAGQGSRLVITGDTEQSDLPPGEDNGLAEALWLFGRSKVASIHKFSEADITRDPLVREVVRAYRLKYAARARAERMASESLTPA